MWMISRPLVTKIGNPNEMLLKFGRFSGYYSNNWVLKNLELLHLISVKLFSSDSQISLFILNRLIYSQQMLVQLDLDIAEISHSSNLWMSWRVLAIQLVLSRNWKCLYLVLNVVFGTSYV